MVTLIRVSSPRKTVCVTFPDGLVLEGPVGTTVEAFLIAAEQTRPGRHNSALMGGILDGRLRELSYPVMQDAALDSVLLTSSDGGRIYRRSLVMLLATAIEELWPGQKVSVNYAVPDGGFYCKLLNHPPLSSDQLVQLENHMRQIVADNDPITKRLVPLDEATELFRGRNDEDKVRLLEQRTRNDLTLYTLRGRDDYYYGYMVPSTGYLQVFRLIGANGGFILQYPRKETPAHLGEMTAAGKLTRVFQEADDWLRRMEVEDIGSLNRAVREDRIAELILVAEALHEQRIAYIAREISEKHQSEGVRLVLIAGPTSSGKTTFAKRLSIQVLAHGLRPFTLELDNYFVNRELTPKDENGEYDFEALGAVNLELFNEHLLKLIHGEEVRLPSFDFVHGISREGQTARLRENQIIIVEGIHGLNPSLVPQIPPEVIYRVYVSALTQLNIDSHNRVPTTDVRLLRRIVRDAAHRGNSATATLLRWESVRRGEKLNIFPYQENADAMFNSALVYELAALRELVEPLLLQVTPATPPHIEANRLLSFLRWVQPLSPHQQGMIPDTSLLREFIGGSILQDYRP
jgi:uridine kinase